ncbi:MAG: trypsin-like peptidase domain-containing protein [Acidobacteria bacterium]|nr:trypsin-like peptidase domain-containing protein [Acidobacteriota bacterium]
MTTNDRFPFLLTIHSRRAITVACLTLVVFGSCRETPQELDAVQKMAYAVKPAVVRVSSYATATVTINATKADATDHATEIETGAGGSGTGFVIHPDGWILTSAHVVSPTQDEKDVREQLIRNGSLMFLQRALDEDVVRTLVRSGQIETTIARLAQSAALSNVEIVNRIDLSNGRSLPFEVVRLSPTFALGGDDLALLRIEAKGLPTLSLAERETRLQEQIWIAGYPSVASSEDSMIGGWLSAETDLEPTITSGSITAIRRSTSSQLIYQTDAPVYPGHSGGPAVDRRGVVVGIPTWGHSEADQIRFLIPAVTAKDFLARTGVPADVEGPFNKAYRGALDAAGEGRWDVAIARLKYADARFPGSPDVKRFLNEAERRTGHASRVRYTDIAAVVAFGVAILVLVLAVSRVRLRPRKRPEMPPLREHVIVRPLRGDRNGSDAISLNENGSESLGTFTILNGSDAGRRMGLGGSGIRIGRESRYCEIVLSDPKISRLHAEVVTFDGRTMLIDRNSSNGTFVNDEQIERTFLHDGDIIYFGGRHAVAVAFTL